jgi:hypothetical protein
MKLSISEEEFLFNFGDRMAHEFDVSWQLAVGRAIWTDVVYNEIYVVRYNDSPVV